MTHCIGRMGGMPGDWRAELDFEFGEAVILECGTTGHSVGPVATVPMGEVAPETDEYSPALDPDDAQNKRLCAIVFAPEAWAALKDIQSTLLRVFPAMQDSPGWVEEVMAQIDDTLECLNVPGRG